MEPYTNVEEKKLNLFLEESGSFQDILISSNQQNTNRNLRKSFMTEYLSNPKDQLKQELFKRKNKRDSFDTQSLR